MSTKLNRNKSLNLIHVTSSLGIGGAEVMLVDLINQLRHKGFEQKVIYFRGGPHVERISTLGISVYQIKGIVCLYDPIFFLRLFLLMKKLKPDCIHTLLWAANLAGRMVARLLNIPVVMAMHNNVDQNGLIRNFLDSLTLHKRDTIVAVSEGVKQSVEAAFPAKKLGSINVIANGIDAESYSLQGRQLRKRRDELGLNDYHFVVGSVGRFVSIKNYPLLIEQLDVLMKKFSHVRAILLGIGSQAEYLKQKIKNYGLEQKIVLLTNKKAVGYYPLFDCFVLPSYKEGLSMALLEAMSFGLPCIAGNHRPEHDVIISGLNGLVVTPGQSFAAAICQLVENPGLRRQLGLNVCETVKKRFSLNHMTNEYAKLFREKVF